MPAMVRALTIPLPVQFILQCDARKDCDLNPKNIHGVYLSNWKNKRYQNNTRVNGRLYGRSFYGDAMKKIPFMFFYLAKEKQLWGKTNNNHQ
ncbi:hypothetical protein [Peribacillus sp. SCS-155]|uniref:hypothetical protein n=1 Tax=Peribacillus sedimenti TaxID=3115297 RepID=UPI00390619F1